jgi:hypothetical protein
MFYNRHFVKLGQPYALVDFNPTSHLPLTPVRGLRIWAQSGESGKWPHTHSHYSPLLGVLPETNSCKDDFCFNLLVPPLD